MALHKYCLMQMFLSYLISCYKQYEECSDISNCQVGPYSIRKSTAKHSCSRGFDSVMSKCFDECLKSSCCRTLDIVNNHCVKSPILTEAHAFVKEGICETCFPVEKCIDGQTCMVQFGSGSQLTFSSQKYFFATEKLINMITVIADAYVYGLHLGYADLIMKDNPDAKGVTFYCEFSSNDQIHTIHVYEGSSADTKSIVVAGITFISNKLTCGPIGTTFGTKHVIKGHMLLYVEGMRSVLYESLRFIFLSQCEAIFAERALVDDVKVVDKIATPVVR